MGKRGSKGGILSRDLSGVWGGGAVNIELLLHLSVSD